MKVAIIRNWRKYNLPHVMCGFVNPADFGAFNEVDITFGDGSYITVNSEDRDDLIITDIDDIQIEE